MALVLFLRGINVGGHRRFRPTTLAAALRPFDVVSVGAAGTFVVRGPVRPAALRVAVAERLPFEAEIMICRGSEVARLLSQDWFRGRPSRPDVVRFVSILSRPARRRPRLPLTLPARGRWMLRVLGRDGRLVVGEYRRELQVLRYLGQLDAVFGAPVTTRSWTTLGAVARVIDAG